MIIVFAICSFVLPRNVKYKVKAEVSGPYNKSYMSQYYYDLVYNFPESYETCGYVAISMLLSYYDNYLNANIIAENYEKRETGCFGVFKGIGISPGVRYAGKYYDDAPEIDEETDANTFFSSLIAQSDFYFQGRLFEIAQQKGYLSQSNFTDESGLLTMREVVEVLRVYLNSLGCVEKSSNQETNLALEEYEYAFSECVNGWFWGIVTFRKRKTYSL